MNRVKVKICGVRTLEEAEAAIEAEADALGFNFWPHSPRYLAPADAAEITKRLSPLVTLIGVFVNEKRERIVEIASGMHSPRAPWQPTVLRNRTCCAAPSMRTCQLSL